MYQLFLLCPCSKRVPFLLNVVKERSDYETISWNLRNFAANKFLDIDVD